MIPGGSFLASILEDARSAWIVSGATRPHGKNEQCQSESAKMVAMVTLRPCFWWTREPHLFCHKGVVGVVGGVCIHGVASRGVNRDQVFLRWYFPDPVLDADAQLGNVSTYSGKVRTCAGADPRPGVRHSGSDGPKVLAVNFSAAALEKHTLWSKLEPIVLCLLCCTFKESRSH